MYPSNSSSSSGVTQLEFNQAMSDFKHMFPDMEEDIIEAILRANNGVVDTTIDQLLQINNETQEKKKRNKKMEQNKRNRQITSMNDDPEMAQYLEDERFAILLQNEEFVRELRMNQDFMSTLDADNNSSSGGHYSGSSNTTGVGGVNDQTQASNFLDSDAIFKERLRNMGKLSKKKFTQIARLFSGRMRKNFKQLDNGGGAGAGGGTLSTGTNRENQYFYQDLNNENYEDTALPSSSSTSNDHHQQQHHNHHHHHHHHHSHHNHQDHS
uniref:CUE domain-containing protein 1-like n=1 Tax=Dermatophagoides pteronyssinus TaxID=6956 RepID=A0A6P6YDV3_DERPT|nr:CUE domain-containing protein 1-like [Dermatophagoides pteronyssinus]